jgi:hypothetical protein
VNAHIRSTQQTGGVREIDRKINRAVVRIDGPEAGIDLVDKICD